MGNRIEYFITKLDAIPEENWTTGEIRDDETGACCVLGHCGAKTVKDGSELPERDKIHGWLMTDEAYELADLIAGGSVDRLWMINDRPCGYPGETPKQRILNKLKEAQANG